MAAVIRVGVVGDYNEQFRGHVTIGSSVAYASAALNVPAEAIWVATGEVTRENAAQRLGGFDAIWGAPGSPFRSFDGMLAAISYARLRGRPYLGTCAGFQYALIEFARNVLGIADADSAENETGSKNIVIAPVSCAVQNRPANAPKLFGEGHVRLLPHTRLHEIYGSNEAFEGYFCNFEVNPHFRPQLERAGMVVTALGPNGEIRAIELPGHRFFIATLFQPQLASVSGRPHPIAVRLLREAARLQSEMAAPGELAATPGL